MINNEIKVDEFKSSEQKRSTRRHRTTARQAKRHRTDRAFNSIMVKVGICLAIFGVIGIARLIDSEKIGTVYVADKNNNEKDEPGRLRFVELPGILEVFAGRNKFTVPVASYSSATLNSDSTELKLKVNAGDYVVSACDGTIKRIGSDGGSQYVIISADDGVEVICSGLSDITAEQNQPVKKLDNLGIALGEDITVRVIKNGEPQNPCDYISIGNIGKEA